MLPNLCSLWKIYHPERDLPDAGCSLTGFPLGLRESSGMGTGILEQDEWSAKEWVELSMWAVVSSRTEDNLAPV